MNRTGHGKRFGIVVDYYGPGEPTSREALKVYADEDIGVASSPKNEIPACVTGIARGEPVPPTASMTHRARGLHRGAG